MGLRNADRPPPYRRIAGDEAGQEILVRAVWHTVAETHPNDLVAGAAGPVPGTVQGHEGVALVLRRKCGRACWLIERHRKRRGMRLDQHIGHAHPAGEVRALSLVGGVLMVADIEPGPAI